MILSLSPTFLPCLLHVFLLSVPCRRQEWNDIHHRGNLAGNFHWLIPSVLKEDQFELVFHLAPGFSMPAPIISRFDWVIPADCSALPLPYRNSCGIRHQSPIKADLPFNYTTFSNQPPRTELFLPASALLQFPTDSIPIVSLMNPNLLHIGLRRGLLTQIKFERSEHRITSSCSSVNTHTHKMAASILIREPRERESIRQRFADGFNASASSQDFVWGMEDLIWLRSSEKKRGAGFQERDAPAASRKPVAGPFPRISSPSLPSSHKIPRISPADKPARKLENGAQWQKKMGEYFNKCIYFF